MEHWIVVSGEGVVTLNDVLIEVVPGSIVRVEIGMAHRVENTNNEDLVFIEVQRGDYLEEDDIARIEDDFGRSS